MPPFLGLRAGAQSNLCPRCSPVPKSSHGLANPQRSQGLEGRPCNCNSSAVDSGNVAGFLAIIQLGPRGAEHQRCKGRQQYTASKHVAVHRVQYDTVAAQSNWTWNAFAHGSALLISRFCLDEGHRGHPCATGAPPMTKAAPSATRGSSG